MINSIGSSTFFSRTSCDVDNVLRNGNSKSKTDKTIAMIEKLDANGIQKVPLSSKLDDSNDNFDDFYFENDYHSGNQAVATNSTINTHDETLTTETITSITSEIEVSTECHAKIIQTKEFIYSEKSLQLQKESIQNTTTTTLTR